MPTESDVVSKLRQLRDQPVRLIVRTVGNPQDHLAELEQQGLQVQRVFRLIRAVAVKGPASAALRLMSHNWVKGIEEDGEVHTQPSSSTRGAQR
jgi:hypothetical protein